MTEIHVINLHIDDQVFPVKKDVLCKHSDYFRAMFSGNYIEEEQRNITIDAIGADSMLIILRYMDLGSLDFAEYTLPQICTLAMAANFLQMTELLKQIEFCFDPQLTESNCMEVLNMAENCLYSKLEYLSAAFGLLSFKSMKPEHITTIDRLVWYLSHPYLDVDNEIDVFKFGFDWISQTETGGDVLLIIFGCLDITRLTSNDLNEISVLIKDCKNSLIERVINCLQWLCMNGEISLEAVTTKESILCEKFGKQVHIETYNIVKESKQRLLKYTVVVQRVSSWKEICKLYKYTEEMGMEECLILPKENLWRWSIAVWGNTKLVVCSINGNTDHQTKRAVPVVLDILLYDTLRKEWINHAVGLPALLDPSIAVIDNLLYIIGRCDPRQPSKIITSIIYNLNKRTYRRMAASPGGKKLVQLCSHNGSLYAASIPKRLYVYESGQRDCWRQLPIHKKMYDRHEITALISFNEYIYMCSDGHFIQRIRPEVDDSWELLSLGRDDISTVTMTSLRTHLLIFLEGRTSDEIEMVSFSENNVNNKLRLKFDPQITDKAKSCLLVLDLPSSLRTEMSKYYKKYFSL